MKCWLCSEHEIKDLILDVRDNKLNPCSTCQAITQENLEMISKPKKDTQSELLELEPKDGEINMLDEDFDIESESFWENLPIINSFEDE